MRSTVPFRAVRHRRGVALVIVLTFVVLLTGLVLAFFSRAISERQISNGSAGEVRADLFAQGAADTIVGDLRQEIAAGSPNAVTVATDVTVYPPKPATAVPALVLGTAVNNGGLNNLVKRSARTQPFFPATANYNTSNYPASNRAAAVGSDAPSINGRYVSADRWNKGLLLAKKDQGTESVTPTSDFVSPDWVLVARDGSNPTVWNANMVTSSTGLTPVVGRYAYNIYDEGGMLDANAAGYPSTSTAAQSGYKPALAYADLSQVLDPNGSDPKGTAKQIDALVGWRNYASIQAPAAFPSPALTATSATNYFNFVLGNTRGFLTTGAMALYNKQSDRMFGSRQELIKLLLQGVATDSASRIKLQNALQYLGTFSRGLEQPSFIKTQSVDQNDKLGFDSTAPKLLAPNLGGNNAGPVGGSLGLDAAINPSFLAVRVKTTTKATATTGRFDGSDLVIGEPLVKKRFALNRLAWLTYKGPSSQNMNDTVVQKTIKALGGDPSNPNDPVTKFVAKGTATNIGNYFGLSWDASSNRWNYDQHNRGGSTGKAICKLSYANDGMDVLRAGREADFFELLKASVNVGSLGKSGTLASSDTTNPNVSKLLPSQLSQYDDDSRVDDAIIQMGANIIDQFDLDSYSTQISFNDGGSALGAKTFHGVENLPYLSRVIDTLVRVKQADTTVKAGVIGDTGVGALLQCPEMWNPHDYNTSNVDQSAGVAGPTKFRIYAESGTQGVNTQVQLLGVIRDQGSGNGHRHTNAASAKSPGYESAYHFTFANPELRALTPTNTTLEFSVPSGTAGLTRFREPTILFQNTQDGGYVDKSPAPSYFDAIGKNPGFFTGNNGFKSEADSGVGGAPPSAGKGYVGFYLGALPLFWADGAAGGNPPYWLDNIAANIPTDVHYYVQYEYPANSGQYVTYDEKYRTLGGSGIYSENSTLSGGGARSTTTGGWESFLYPRKTGDSSNWDAAYAAMDPRTPRFGLLKLTAGKSSARYWAYSPYGADGIGTAMPSRAATLYTVGYNQGRINVGSGVVLGTRSGTSDGAGFMCPLGVLPDSMGWVPGSGGTISTNNVGRFASYSNLSLGVVSSDMICRPGAFSINNPYTRRSDRPWGDSGDPVDSAFLPSSTSNAAEYYTDADGVVRRASGGLVPYDGNSVTSDTGLSMTPANAYGTGRLDQSDSRPVVLNRPFRTVGELAYTFSGTPWKNINFSMPESGEAALLDVFSVNDTDDANGLVAGKVDLNTRQAPVLQAIIAGAYKDEWNPSTRALVGGSTNSVAAKVAQALVKRTSNSVPANGSNPTTAQPLTNVSELVGRYVGGYPSSSNSAINSDQNILIPRQGHPATIFSPRNYDGFSADLINNAIPPPGGPTGVLVSEPYNTIPRFANAAVRALSNSGQTRVWNLLIDVVAQTGRYPQSATSPDKFNVEGEQRYWVHVAIDRFTGQVVDKQVEVVKE